MLHVRRRHAAVIGLAVAGTVLPGLALTTASAAPVYCKHEPDAFLGMSAVCDDNVAPVTTITAERPSGINDAGWARSKGITFAFTGSHTDGDTDPIGLQCRLAGGPLTAAASRHEWQTCTSPRSYPDLTDSKTEPYTFEVRAVDLVDNAITYYDVLTPSDTPDYDTTPATRTWLQDSVNPGTNLFEGPAYDDVTPNFPMLMARWVRFDPRNTEKYDLFTCSFDGKAGCPAAWTLTGLSSRTHTFTVAARDLAGNVDPTPATSRFTVPWNNIGTTKQRLSWTRKTGTGYFLGDAQYTTKRWAFLTRKVGTIREVRLIVEKGPGYGRVYVSAGGVGLGKFSLAAPTVRRKQVIQVAFPGNARYTGPIKVMVISAGKPVYIDGVLAR